MDGWTACLIDWLSDWLIDRLFDWLIDCCHLIINYFIHHHFRELIYVICFNVELAICILPFAVFLFIHPVGGTGTQPRLPPFPLDLQRVGGSLLGRLANHNYAPALAARNWREKDALRHRIFIFVKMFLLNMFEIVVLCFLRLKCLEIIAAHESKRFRERA